MTGRRRVMLGALAGLLVVCAAAGGATWYATRCNRDDYLSAATASWTNTSEEYLFACGQVWHSLDAGQTWTRIPAQGLPLLVRNGSIAEDRTPGLLYLAVLLAAPTSANCLLCPLTVVRPTIFISDDGGGAWRQAMYFPEGPNGITHFRTLSSNPDYENAAWIVLVTGEQVIYWATNDGGQDWIPSCEERIGYFCDPPSDFMALHASHRHSESP